MTSGFRGKVNFGRWLLGGDEIELKHRVGRDLQRQFSIRKSSREDSDSVATQPIWQRGNGLVSESRYQQTSSER
jgi:hypothetical protein